MQHVREGEAWRAACSKKWSSEVRSNNKLYSAPLTRLKLEAELPVLQLTGCGSVWVPERRDQGQGQVLCWYWFYELSCCCSQVSTYQKRTMRSTIFSINKTLSLCIPLLPEILFRGHWAITLRCIFFSYSAFCTEIHFTPKYNGEYSSHLVAV